jgi:hypothetical protein
MHGLPRRHVLVTANGIQALAGSQPLADFSGDLGRVEAWAARHSFPPAGDQREPASAGRQWLARHPGSTIACGNYNAINLRFEPFSSGNPSR